MTGTEHIGSMRHRIRLERPVDMPDGAGGSIRTWQLAAESWASVTPIVAGEDGLDEQVQDLGRMRILMRWRAGIDASMRLIHDGRTYEIDSVTDPDARKRFLTVDAREMRS